MKKLVLCLVSISVFAQLYCVDDSKQLPPAYEDHSVKDLSHANFLNPLNGDAGTIGLRAETYFLGSSRMPPEPIMGFALAQIAADAGDAQACRYLANQLLEHPFIDQSVVSRNMAKALLCRAVKLSDPHGHALQKLWQLSDKKKQLSKDDAIQAIEGEDLSGKALLKYLRNPVINYPIDDIHQAGILFLEGNSDGLNRDPLRALALFCYIFNKFPNSSLGPQVLAEFMISHGEQHVLFKNNKQIASHYATIARKRGLPNDTQQHLNQAIEKCVEPPQERTFWESCWDIMTDIFG